MPIVSDPVKSELNSKRHFFRRSNPSSGNFSGVRARILSFSGLGMIRRATSLCFQVQARIARVQSGQACVSSWLSRDRLRHVFKLHLHRRHLVGALQAVLLPLGFGFVQRLLVADLARVGKHLAA